MPEWVVACGGAPAPPKARVLRVRLSGPQRNFRLEIDQISQTMAARIPERLVDLLEIASYIFAADQSISRGGDTRRDWGADWRRSTRFVIPVRDEAFWSHGAVRSALARALSFLSEDNYRFEFLRSSTPADPQEYLPIAADEETGFRADEVILFSGGLDSLAGAVKTLAQTDRRIALVSHRSAPKVLSYQRALADALRSRFPGRVFPIQVYGTRSGGSRDARERTRRTRSFLYAALGFVVGRMFGATRLQLCENGVVSINLPFSEQIIGTMATRSTHPYAVRLIQELLALVADEPVDLENPFIWRTKADVLESLRQHEAADLVRQSISCSNVHTISRTQTHCGRCSQCLDRRFAALAVGMGDDDPGHLYATDLLFGPRERARDRIMAVDFARHGVALADMTEVQFFAGFGGELSRVIEGFPYERADVVGERCYRLLKRHGEAVKGVLADAVAWANREIVAKELPATSLLRAYLASDGGPTPAEPPIEMETPLFAAPEEPEPTASVFPLQITLDRTRREARIIGVDAIAGRQFDVLNALAGYHQRDVEEGRLLDQYRFVSANELADVLETDVENVRQLVRRLRGEFVEAITAIEGRPPDQERLIETNPRSGYRLHPEVRIVSATEH